MTNWSDRLFYSQKVKGKNTEDQNEIAKKRVTSYSDLNHFNQLQNRMIKAVSQIPYGKVNANTDMALVQNMEGSLYLELATGHTLARLEGAPLFLDDLFLYTYSVIELEAKTAIKVRVYSSDSYQMIANQRIENLPYWIIGDTQGDDPAGSFEIKILPGYDELTIEIIAATSYRGGAAISTEMKQQYAKQLYRRYQLCLSDTRLEIENLSADEIPAEELREQPEVSEIYKRDFKYESQTWESEGNKYALRSDAENNNKTVSMQQHKAEGFKPLHHLPEGEIHLALDRDHVLTTQSEGQAHLLALKTSRSYDLPNLKDVQSFSVNNDYLIALIDDEEEQSRKLQVHKLSTGNQTAKIELFKFRKEPPPLPC